MENLIQNSKIAYLAAIKMVKEGEWVSFGNR
jgi:hypothetical protein